MPSVYRKEETKILCWINFASVRLIFLSQVFVCNFEMQCIYEKPFLPDSETYTANNQI